MAPKYQHLFIARPRREVSKNIDFFVSVAAAPKQGTRLTMIAMRMCIAVEQPIRRSDGLPGGLPIESR
jgi:hypothetical protein